MPATSGRETIFGKNCLLTADTLGVKTFVKITLFHTVSEINGFLHFYAQFQDACQKWQENDFWKKLHTDFGYPEGLSRSISLRF